MQDQSRSLDVILRRVIYRRGIITSQWLYRMSHYNFFMDLEKAIDLWLSLWKKY